MTIARYREGMSASTKRSLVEEEEPAEAPRERELEPALTPVRARPSRPGRTEGFLG